MDEKPKGEFIKEIKELIRVKIDIYGLTEADIAYLRENARRILETRQQ